MRDALESGASVNCTFVFDDETIVSEDVYLVGVTKLHHPSYDVYRIRQFEIGVREVS